MKTYTYKIWWVQDQHLEGELNRLGCEGWRLVTLRYDKEQDCHKCIFELEGENNVT